MDPIAPVTSVIDRTEELLGHSPHPAIVTLPLGAWCVSNLCDGLALASGRRQYDDAARLSLGLGLVGAVGAVATGLRDYSFIPEDRPSHEVATQHALGNAVVGTLMTTSYILRVRDQARGRRASLTARLLALAGGGLSLYTAWLGGVLVEEQGEGVQPVMDAQGQNESLASAGTQEGDHAEGHGRERLSPQAPLGPHN